MQPPPQSVAMNVEEGQWQSVEMFCSQNEPFSQGWLLGAVKKRTTEHFQ